MSKKLHNPKSHAPAVYLPCWLIQVPINLLSHGAKMTYGRLSQWANNVGHAYRSSKNLALEIGVSEKSIEKYIFELKNNNLIGTYHPQAGGVNHFEFYDHPWMYEAIKDQLVYTQDKYDLPSNPREPSLQSEGTLPSNPRDINIKEIKEIKCVGENPSLTQKSTKPNPKKLAEERAITSPEIKELFDSKFSGLDISIEELFASCQEHYEQKSLWASKHRFLKWVKNEKTDNYNKITNKQILDPSKPSIVDFQEYNAGVKGFEFVGEWIKKQNK